MAREQMSSEKLLQRTGRSSGPSGLDIEGFSNGIRLTGREWIVVGLFTVALFLCAPFLWTKNEAFTLESDYRMPYDLSNDYWLYERYARQAAEQYDTLLFGDSVVWGQYVTRQQTLSHYLNERAGKERFANLGLDGAHPAALAGLLEHYARPVTNKNVILQCNPLWLSSSKYDLQDEEEFAFNHPGLVPQFLPGIPCYKAEISPRIGILVEQRLPFSSWTNHLQQAYFDRSDIPSWTMEHPYDNPLKQFKHGLPPSDNILRHEAISWTARGIQEQDYPWVDLETSFQWRFFRRAVEILEGRGNRVFVIVGPFNEHAMQEKSHETYQKIKNGIAAWLQAKSIAHIVPPPLASELYADASHPLADGYRMLAKEIFQRLP
jgi:hypothetical protein